MAITRLRPYQRTELAHRAIVIKTARRYHLSADMLARVRGALAAQGIEHNPGSFWDAFDAAREVRS